jgi:indolepyruvate ferredoxin oxidoreductase beta subunit
LTRLEAVRDLDAQHSHHDFRLLNETARYLALWMSYEDAARVADLKTRRARFERVRQDSRAQSAQLVQINEFIYPRVQEIADMMPVRVGRWLLTSRSARRTAERLLGHGRVVQTTSMSGFLQLYLVAELRRWRRRSLRFREEHTRIAQWLQALKQFANQDYAAAVQVAEFPRVVKGYGDTHINGVHKFELLMQSLASVRGRKDAHTILRSLIDAALADENGTKLQEALATITRPEVKETAQFAARQAIASQPPVAG